MKLIAEGNYNSKAKNLIQASEAKTEEIANVVIKLAAGGLQPVTTVEKYLKHADPEHLLFFLLYGIDSLMADLAKSVKEDLEKGQS